LNADFRQRYERFVMAIKRTQLGLTVTCSAAAVPQDAELGDIAISYDTCVKPPNQTRRLRTGASVEPFICWGSITVTTMVRGKD
jgi:hypothetical protein